MCHILIIPLLPIPKLELLLLLTISNLIQTPTNSLRSRLLQLRLLVQPSYILPSFLLTIITTIIIVIIASRIVTRFMTRFLGDCWGWGWVQCIELEDIGGRFGLVWGLEFCVF